jgi:hypothetical protein
LTLTISYVAPSDGDTPAPELSLQAWDGEADRWQVIPFTIDRTAQTLTAQIERPLRFGLFAREAAPDEEQGSLRIYLPAVQR